MANQALNTVTEVDADALATAPEAGKAGKKRRSVWHRLSLNWSVRIGGVILALLIAMSLLAPWLGTINPTEMDPGSANLLPGVSVEFNSLSGDTFQHTFYMGSDSLGRDIYSRIAFGGRVSITVGISVALLALALGVPLGMLGGYFRRIDSILMRLMDGVMAIPGILFA